MAPSGKASIMNQTDLWPSLLLLAALGCGGGGQSTSRPAAFVENNELSEQSGGHVTVGLRVLLDGDDDGSRTHLEAVIVNLQGEESTTDLGVYDGTLQQIAPGPSEVGHLQYNEGDIVHDLVLVETPDHQRLQLRIDGVVVREIPLPPHEVVDAQSPFLLRPPFSD